jgi:hypothetical protein
MRNENERNHFPRGNIGGNTAIPAIKGMVTLQRQAPSLDLCLLSAQFHG